MSDTADLLTRLRAGDDLHCEAAATIQRLSERLVTVEAELAVTLGVLDRHRQEQGPSFSIKYEKE